MSWLIKVSTDGASTDGAGLTVQPLSFSRDGFVVILINGKRYEYQVSDPERVWGLTNSKSYKFRPSKTISLLKSLDMNKGGVQEPTLFD